MLIKCPNCNQLIFIEQLNCGIFRCGIYKSNFQHIPPHLPKKDCDELLNKNLIYGCSKPFKIVGGTVLICDYI